jgi:hypothetical protein
VRAATGCSPPEPLNGKAISSSQQKKRARATSLFGGCGRYIPSEAALCYRTTTSLLHCTASVYTHLTSDAQNPDTQAPAPW